MVTVGFVVAAFGFIIQCYDLGQIPFERVLIGIAGESLNFHIIIASCKFMQRKCFVIGRTLGFFDQIAFAVIQVKVKIAFPGLEVNGNGTGCPTRCIEGKLVIVHIVSRINGKLIQRAGKTGKFNGFIHRVIIKSIRIKTQSDTGVEADFKMHIASGIDRKRVVVAADIQSFTVGGNCAVSDRAIAYTHTSGKVFRSLSQLVTTGYLHLANCDRIVRSAGNQRKIVDDIIIFRSSAGYGKVDGAAGSCGNCCTVSNRQSSAMHAAPGNIHFAAFCNDCIACRTTVGNIHHHAGIDCKITDFCIFHFKGRTVVTALNIGIGSYKHIQVGTVGSNNITGRTAAGNIDTASGIDRGIFCCTAAGNVDQTVGIDCGIFCLAAFLYVKSAICQNCTIGTTAIIYIHIAVDRGIACCTAIKDPHNVISGERFAGKQCAVIGQHAAAVDKHRVIAEY